MQDTLRRPWNRTRARGEASQTLKRQPGWGGVGGCGGAQSPLAHPRAPADPKTTFPPSSSRNEQPQQGGGGLQGRPLNQDLTSCSTKDSTSRFAISGPALGGRSPLPGPEAGVWWWGRWGAIKTTEATRSIPRCAISFQLDVPQTSSSQFLCTPKKGFTGKQEGREGGKGKSTNRIPSVDKESLTTVWGWACRVE